MRDPVKWYQSVTNTIFRIAPFLAESWAAAPLRLIGRLLGKCTVGPSGLTPLPSPQAEALFTCTAPTYLGARYCAMCRRVTLGAKGAKIV